MSALAATTILNDVPPTRIGRGDVTSITTGRDGEEGGLRSVSIAVAVLDCFDGSTELGATQVAREIGIAKSTACRMLAALAAGGLLERESGGRYRLGMRLFEYGSLAVERLPLRAVARPVLLELQASLKETVQLGVAVGGHVLFVERFGTGLATSRLAGELFRRVPGYSSSAGRALAAYDPDVRSATLSVRRLRHTSSTTVDAARLEQLFAATRRRGWASSCEELEAGYSSVAAPVLVGTPDGPRPVAAVSVAGRTPHVLGPRKDVVVASVLRAARRISTSVAWMTPA